MFRHVKKLQYTVRVSEPNPGLANLLLEQFGGPQGELAAAMLALMCLGFGLTQGLPAVSFQAVTPNRVRARVIALYLLIGNIVAFTVGPTAVVIRSTSAIRLIASWPALLTALTLLTVSTVACSPTTCTS